MPSTPSSIAAYWCSAQSETVAASVLAPLHTSPTGGVHGGGLMRTHQPVQGVDVRVGGRLDDVERGSPPDHDLRPLAEGNDRFAQRVAPLGRRRQAEVLELGGHAGDLLNGAEDRGAGTGAARPPRTA